MLLVRQQSERNDCDDEYFVNATTCKLARDKDEDERDDGAKSEEVQMEWLA